MAVKTGAISEGKHEHHLTREKLRMGFFLTLLLLLIELAGGVAAHSLALLSDAGHMLTDIGAFGLAWFAAASSAVTLASRAAIRSSIGCHPSDVKVVIVLGIKLGP